MDKLKAQTIAMGESAGEDAAQALYLSGGIDAVAETLRPRPFECYSTGFYELWKGGDEPWLRMVQQRGIAQEIGAHPYYIKAFDAVFCRGARRWSEMLVRGYLDGLAGVPFAGPEGDSLAAAESRLMLRRRRCALGDRPALVAAYETGHRLATEEG